MTRRRRTGSSKGRFVIIVGPDGVGKTTIAREIAARRQPSVYFHFLPPLSTGLGPVPSPEDAAMMSKREHETGGSRALSFVRLARNTIRYWTGYMLRVWPAVRRGWLVIGDRGLYGYVAQPASLRYFGSKWVARTTMRIVPNPDLIVNLTAEPTKILARKSELSLQQIERELIAWTRLPARNLVTIVNEGRLEDVVEQILYRLEVCVGDSDDSDVAAAQQPQGIYDVRR